MQLKHRMKRNRKATHIQWDVDNLEDLELLPTEIDIPDDMTDMEEISDYITDQTELLRPDFGGLGLAGCGGSLVYRA